MNDDFIRLLCRLKEAKFDFVIIGGFAAAVHGSTFVTQDIDICCSFKFENLMHLQQAVSDLHPVHRMTTNKIPFILTEENFRHLNNLYLDTDLGQLDCLGHVQGLGNYHEVKSKSVSINISNQSFWVLQLDALIESKEALGRPRDLEMLRYLKSLQELKKESE